MGFVCAPRASAPPAAGSTGTRGFPQNPQTKGADLRARGFPGRKRPQAVGLAAFHRLAKRAAGRWESPRAGKRSCVQRGLPWARAAAKSKNGSSDPGHFHGRGLAGALKDAPEAVQRRSDAFAQKLQQQAAEIARGAVWIEEILLRGDVEVVALVDIPRIFARAVSALPGVPASKVKAGSSAAGALSSVGAGASAGTGVAPGCGV